MTYDFEEAVEMIAFLMQDDGFLGNAESATRTGREYALRIFGADDGEKVFAAACSQLGMAVPAIGRPN